MKTFLCVDNVLCHNKRNCSPSYLKYSQRKNMLTPIYVKIPSSEHLPVSGSGYKRILCCSYYVFRQ